MNDNPAVAKLETLLTAKQFSDAYDLCVALVGSDPSSLDGWWGMTRAAKALGRWDEAKNAAKETIGLVPRWPVIWGEYGFIHEMLGQDDQARKAYEAGIKLDSNYAYGHSRLLLLCKKVNDRAGVISHGQALERSGFAGADVLDSVANAFWYNANFHMSLHYFKKSANLEPQAFRYSNVGLVYERPELNQSLDAVDAYRRALALNGTHEPALNGKRRTSEKLLKTAQELARLGQDVKEKDNFFQFYINPFMLLGIESGTLKESVTIAFIQKRKKALVQELELEDGWVETISHHLDKSRALSVCDDLLDDQKRAFHWLERFPAELNRV